MNRKYFFFDIDGTLTEKKSGQIVDSVYETIRRLKDNGHFVCIATGRAHYKTIKIAKELGIENIVSNGGRALTINNRLIENLPLDHHKAVTLCQQAEQLGYGVLVSTGDNIDVTMINERFIEQVGYRQEPTRYILNRSLLYQDIKDIYKIYIAISKEEESQLTLKDSLGNIRFVDSYLTYQHDDKDIGIKKMIELIDGKNEDVVVFGDDYNDLVMFKKEWTAIAMGNSCDELKQKATFVTKDNIDNGIQYACEYFHWI